LGEVIFRREAEIVNDAHAAADKLAAFGLFILDRDICFIFQQVGDPVRSRERQLYARMTHPEFRLDGGEPIGAERIAGHDMYRPGIGRIGIRHVIMRRGDDIGHEIGMTE